MSLINEALKRTRDAAYQSATPRVPGLESYRVSSPKPPGRRNRPALWVVCVAGVVAGLGATLVYAYFHRPPLPVVIPAPVIVAVPPPVPVVEPAPPEPPPVVAALPAPEPEPPKLTLQGITIDPGAGHEALINGVSLRVGEAIAGATVTGIDSRRVTLQHAGRELTLRLP